MRTGSQERRVNDSVCRDDAPCRHPLLRCGAEAVNTEPPRAESRRSEVFSVFRSRTPPRSQGKRKHVNQRSVFPNFLELFSFIFQKQTEKPHFHSESR